THAYTTDGEELKRHADLKELFKNLEEPEKTKDLSQRYYFTKINKNLGVTLSGRAIRCKSSLVPRCGLSATIPNAA
nr:hypothetical protein [Flavobacteriales bacterium]